MKVEPILDKKTLPRIIAAAIEHAGIVFTGFRHCEIILYLVKLGYTTPIPNNGQGFITDTGEFLSRYKALNIARRNGQVPKTFNRVLTSEDLW